MLKPARTPTIIRGPFAACPSSPPGTTSSGPPESQKGGTSESLQCYAFDVTLIQHLDRAAAATGAAWDAIEGPITIKETRSQLFLAYASIALEHQEAIILLLRHGLRGSAVALIRPVFEIFYRASWIHHCAKPNQIDRIKKGKFRFPEMGAMVAAIDKAIGETFFQQFKADSWKKQNDFTHTGSFQVNSR